MKENLNINGLWLGADKLPEAQADVNRMVELALKCGVSIFQAERKLVQALKKYPRCSYKLFARCDLYELQAETAGKYFEDLRAQLAVEKLDFCQLEYLNEATAFPPFREAEHIGSMAKLRDEGSVDRLGVYFSGRHDALGSFLEKYAPQLDYCTMRFNYMDFGLEEAGEKLNKIRRAGLDAVALGLTRNGLLTRLPDDAVAELKEARAWDTPLSWCVNYVKNKGLSGCIISAKNIRELEEYINAFAHGKALNLNEDCLLYYIAGNIRRIEEAPPCTDCHHCKDVCPVGLNVAYYVNTHTALKLEKEDWLVRQYRSLPDELRGNRCLGCGKCVFNCPKQIFAPVLMAELEEMVKE